MSVQELETPDTVNEKQVGYSIRPGYKQTEVGLIPEDWNSRTLGDLVTFLDGLRRPVKSADRARMQGRFPYYGASGIVDYVNDYLFDENLILLGEDGENILSRATRLAFQVSGKIWVNNHAHVLRPNKDMNITFLTEILEAQDYSQYNSGTAQPKLNKATCKSILLPVPPTLSEQEAIAEALGDADALIESLERLLAKKRNLKQAAMQQLLRPNADWRTATLFELADEQKSRFDDGDWIESEHITSDGVRLIQTGNIGIGRYVEKETKKYIFETSFESLRCNELQVGDLLICRLAEPAGRACILPEIGDAKVVTSVDVTIFRPRKAIADRTFLVNLFSTSEWFARVLESVGGTTHKRISRGSLGLIEIEIPGLGEQTAIATVLSDMDAEIAAIEAKIDKARLIKAGMMQELLTGKTRLV